MKNLLRSIMTLLLITAGVSALRAYDLVVTVNDPTLVNFMINYASKPLVEGENRFENLSGYNYVYVTSTTDAVIQKVVQNGQTIENPQIVEMNMNDDYGIDTFTMDITAVKMSDMPQSSFTVIIDNPERVDMSLEPKGKRITGLKAGENKVEFLPGIMNYASVSAPYGEAPIYKIETTGQDVPKQYSAGDWEFSLEEGIVVTITADYPDESVPMTFDFNNDGQGCISQIKINGEAIENPDYENFTVKLGSKLEITLNKSDYQLSDFAYNSDHPYMGYTDTYSTYVTGPATIIVDAVKNRMVECKVDVNIGAAALLYKGQQIGVEYNLVKLTDGNNTIEVNATNPYLTLTAADGYVIDQVTLNGENVKYDDYAGCYLISVGEDDEIKITASKIERDQKIAIYITDIDMWSNLTISVGKSTVKDLKNGYNVREYALDELASVGVIGNSWYYDTSDAQLYVNDKLQTPLYTGSFQFDLYDLEDGDVLKVFFKGAPSQYDVTFETEDGVEIKDAMHDIVASFDPAEVQRCFKGTKISFAASDASVKVNDTALGPSENGRYEFEVEGETNVTVSKGSSNSLEEISIEQDADSIYTIEGIRVTESTKLPSGIYIKNGRKVLVSR